MKTYLRTLAALLALLAFSVSFAEQVWATACIPAGAESLAASEGAVAPTHGGHHNAPADQHEPPSAPRSDGCPMQAVTSPCAVVPLPVERPVVLPDPRPDAVVPAATDRILRLLLSAPHFRPPQR